MSQPLPADHATGLELQIGELVAQKARAMRQGRVGDASDLASAITALLSELGEIETLPLTRDVT